MKHVLKLILLSSVLLLLLGCSTSRKLEKNTDKVVADSVSESVSKVADACNVVDTTKTEAGETIITEIIFFGDSARAGFPELIIDKDGKMTIKGGTGVKSIKQTAIRSNVVKNGKTMEQERNTTTKDKATVHKEKKHNEVIKTSRRSNVWTCAIVASIVAVLVLFMWYRKPILAWLRKLLASTRKDLE